MIHLYGNGGLNLDLNGIERVIIQLSVPENYAPTLSLVNIFTGRPSFMDARGVYINGITDVTIHITESNI